MLGALLPTIVGSVALCSARDVAGSANNNGAGGLLFEGKGGGILDMASSSYSVRSPGSWAATRPAPYPVMPVSVLGLALPSEAHMHSSTWSSDGQ